MTLAARVRQGRRSLDLTQSEFADRVGVSRQTIQFIEAGKTLDPRPELLLAIAKLLKVTPAQLRYGNEITTPPPKVEQPLSGDGNVQAIAQTVLAMGQKQRQMIKRILEAVEEIESADEGASRKSDRVPSHGKG